MIYSISSYLKETISKYMTAFLSDSYILNEEVLESFPENVRNSFIQTFCTEKDYKGVHIPVRFTFNAVKPNPYATILIQEKGGKELVNQDQAIGYNMGSSNLQDANKHHETSRLHYDPKTHLAYLQVKYPAHEVNAISNYSGPIKVRGNRIYLLSDIPRHIAKINNNPAERAIITYYSPSTFKHDKRRTYHIEGYDATEDFTIDIITSNIDTLRCLGALMKVIFIAMRLQSKEENSDYYLPKITEAGIDLLQQLNSARNSSDYNDFFYKRFTLNYIVSYTIPQKVGYYINSIVTLPHYDFNVKERNRGQVN